MNRGLLLIVLAEFCFASATVFAKLITNSSAIPAIEITFFRVSIGVAIAALYMIKTKTSFKPHNIKLVIARAVFSFSALIAFFYAVQYGSITKANMLNMTYPVFVFLVAPFFKIEKLHKIAFLFLLIAMTGIYLVIFPDFSNINLGDILGLISGILAAFSVITLAMARENDSTVLIVFYLMAIGTLINAVFLVPVFVMPQIQQLPLLVASGIAGILGQVFLTMGYKHVNARAGSMVSSARIVFAALMGFFFLSEILSLRIFIGGLLIIASIIGVSTLKKQIAANEEQ
ncbi:MAG: DMT family transporter [Bacteroidales bacterium]|nr:DMT family transporter [Bacteroidales bacterium]